MLNNNNVDQHYYPTSSNSSTLVLISSTYIRKPITNNKGEIKLYRDRTPNTLSVFTSDCIYYEGVLKYRPKDDTTRFFNHRGFKDFTKKPDDLKCQIHWVFVFQVFWYHPFFCHRFFKGFSKKAITSNLRIIGFLKSF